VHASKKVRHVDEGARIIKDMIQGKRILLVLDDVNCMDQFDKLAIRCDNFQPGTYNYHFNKKCTCATNGWGAFYL
jgi:hypothetical protein